MDENLQDNLNDELALFTPDIPLNDPNDDLFNHKHFVEVLEYLIQHSKTPLNIALYGKWGVGKSTVLNFLDDRIRHDKNLNKNFRFINIDAWKLSPSSLRQELLLELNILLDKPIEPEIIEDRLWNVHEEDFSIKEGFRKWFRRKGIKLIYYPCIFGAILGGGLSLNQLVGGGWVTPTVVTSLLIPILLAMVQTLQDISKNANRIGKKIIPRVESSHQFQEIFSTIISKQKPKKIIIALDNLDRCDDESVVNILGTVKTFMDVENCIYIIPCDETAIIKHLQRQKGKYEDYDAVEFLNKFFQVAINIPPQIQEGLDTYAEKQMLLFKPTISFDSNVKDVLISGITKNPRKIRQFLYNLVILYKLAKIKEERGIIHKDTVTGNTGFLTKIVVIKGEWPDFYRKLETRHDLLDLIQRNLDGEPLSDPDQNTINEIITKNPGLDYFLKSTNLIKAINPLPFIQLNQESFESTIPQLENFILNVSQNKSDSVKSSLKQLESDQQNNYINEIIKLVHQYIQNRRFQFAFNSLNVLLEVFVLIPLESQNKVVVLFSKFMRTKEIRETLHNFDVDKLFPLVLQMEYGSKEDLLKEYCKMIYRFDKETQKILKNFVNAKSDLSQAVLAEFDLNMQYSGQHSEEKFVKSLEFLLNCEDAYPVLIGQKTINELIQRIDIPSADKTKLNLYRKLKHLASDSNKYDFTRKVLSQLISDKTNALTGNAENALILLKQLDKTDFPTVVSDLVFENVANKITQYDTPDHKISIIELIFKIFSTLSDEKKVVFIIQYLSQSISSFSPPHISRLLNSTKSEKAEILAYDVILDNILERMNQGQIAEEVVDFLFVCSPVDKHEKISNSLIKFITKGTSAFPQIISSSLRNYFALLSEDPKNKLIKALIENGKMRSWNDTYPVFDNITNPLTKCPSQLSDELSDILIDWIRSGDQNQNNYGMSLLLKIFNNLSESNQRSVIREVFSRLETLLAQNNELVRSCFNFIKQVSSNITNQELDRLIDLIIKAMSDIHTPQIRLTGLDIIAGLKLDSRKNDIRIAVENLQINDASIQNRRNEILEILKEN